MSFTVEDGTGLANSNSLTSVATFRDYFTTRGRDVSALTDAAVQSALISGTDYIVSRFGTNLKGVRKLLTQNLPLPRTGMVVDGVTVADTIVPMRIQFATCEYGLRATELAALLPDPPLPFDTEDADGNAIEGGGPVIRRFNKIDVLETEVEMAKPSDARSPASKGTGTVAGWALPAYPAADLMIEPYLASTQGRVIRA